MIVRALPRYLVILMVAAILGFPTGASARDSLLLDGYTELPALGVKLKSFREYPNLPWPGTHAARLTNSVTGEELDGFKPLDLWRQEQIRGNFAGEAGRILVAELTQHPPPQLRLVGGEYALEVDYRNAMKDRASSSFKVDEVRTWVEYFTGQTVDTAETKLRGYDIDYPFCRYTFKDLDSVGVQAYVLLVDRDKQSPTYILVLYEFHGTDNLRDFERSVRNSIESVKWIGRQRPDRGPDRAAQGKARGSRTAEFEAARKRLIDSIENLEDWWYVEMPNYIVTTNLDKRERRLVTMIQEDMELMRGSYAELVPERAVINDVSVIRVFSERQQYLHYVPDEMQWTGGIWMPGKRELVISPIEVDNRRESRRLALSVVYHEGFHQYLYYALGKIETPIWFNEGHAAFFEGADVSTTKKEVDIEEVEHRTRQIEEMQGWGGRFDLSHLLRMTQQDFYSGDSLNLNYAKAYGVVYFLRKAAHLYPGRGYEKVCPLVLDTLTDTKGDWRAASEAVIRAVDMERWEADLQDFWSSRNNRRKAERFNDYKAAMQAPRRPPVGGR